MKERNREGEEEEQGRLKREEGVDCVMKYRRGLCTEERW